MSEYKEYNYELPQSVEDLELDYTRKDYDEMLYGSGPYTEYSLDNFQTNLFPYYAKGPLPAPIPTVSEIWQSEPKEGRIWRVGPYFIKYHSNIELFQVRYIYRHN